MTALYDLFQKPLEEKLLVEGGGAYYFYPEMRFAGRVGLKVEIIGWYHENQHKGIALAVKDGQRRERFTESEAERILSFVEHPTEASFTAFFGTMLGKPKLRPVVEINYKKRFEEIPGIYNLFSSTWNQGQQTEQRWTEQAYKKLHQSQLSGLIRSGADRLHLGSLPTPSNALAALDIEVLREYQRAYMIVDVNKEENFSASISYSKDNEPGFILQHQLYLDSTERVIIPEEVKRLERVAASYEGLDLSEIQFRMFDRPQMGFYRD